MSQDTRSLKSARGGTGMTRSLTRATRRGLGVGRRGAAAILGISLTVAVAACGGGTDAGAETGGAEESTGIEGKQVTFVTFGMQYEFIVGLVSTVEQDLEEAGAVVTIIDGRSDPNLQTTQIQDALPQQPDALIVDPVDPDLMIAGIQSANDQGVPVFIVEALPEGVEYEAFVGYDNIAAGALGAQELAELVGEEGTVLQLRGGEGSKQAGERKEGFDVEMENYPSITVMDLATEWTAENANSMVLDAFTANPDVVGIWSHNDEMLRGSEQALRQLNQLVPADEDGHIAAVGHDGTPLALERIRNGTQDASVVYDAIEMGEIAAANVIAHFDDEPFEKDTIIEPFLADPSNVDDAELWGNLPALNQ